MSEAQVVQIAKAIDSLDLPKDCRVWIEFGSDPEPVVQVGKSLRPVTKGTDEERYVLGVVLEPLKEMGQKDAQDDTYSAEEVRQAAYEYMEKFQNTGLQHEQYVNDDVKILESWIAREDSVIEGQTVTKGTWLMAVRVLSDQIWDDIKKGNYTGFSIGGTAQRERIA